MVCVSEDGLDVYLKEAGKFPVLTREEEQALFAQFRAGDPQARERIIHCNLRFVVKMALRYQNQGLSLPDLIQEGNIGLIEVVDKFDPDRGYRFTTYASFWIRQSIQQALGRHCRLIRLPIRKNRLVGKIREASQAFAKTEGRTPSPDELSEAVSAPVEQIEQMLRLNEAPLSLDAPADEGGVSLENHVPAENALSPRDEAMHSQMALRITQAVKRLSPREQNILSLRYGFGDRRPLSLRNASVMVGLSQEGVRRVEKKALEKLRRRPFAPLLANLL